MSASNLRKIISLLVLCCGWSVGVWANSSSFNGTASHIAGVDSTSLEVATMSIGGWVYVDTAEADVGHLLDKKVAGAQPGWGLFYEEVPSQAIVFLVRWSATAEFRWTAPANNEWHHLCLTYNAGATTNDPSLYIDGQAATGYVESPSPSGTLNLAGTAVYRLGARDGTAQFLNGREAQMFYYNRVLSQDECASIMRYGPQTISNGNILRLPLGTFAARNYTATTGLSGTETNITLGATNPPMNVSGGGLWE